MPNQNELKSFRTLQTLLDELDVSDNFVKKAEELYVKAHQEELYHGKNSTEFALGIIHNVNKLVGCEVDNNLLCSELDIDKQDLLKASRDINKGLNLEVGPEPLKGYFERLREDLDVVEEVEEEAWEIIEYCRKEALHSGKSQYGFVGSAFYSASQLNGGELTQEEVSEACGVSTVTIRKQYKQQINTYEEDNE